MLLKYRNILVVILLMFVFSTCVEQTRSASVWNNGRFEAPLRDLNVIRKEGKLRVLVDYNLTNYFVYRGRPMGFKYEMLRELAKEMGVKLDFVVSNDMEATFMGLETGRFDLAARNLTITKERMRRVDFTQPVMQTRQILVQRSQNALKGTRSFFIRNESDLAGKQVTVPKNTAFVDRLNEIGELIGSQIRIVQDSVAGVEQLFSMVAKGEIDYSVCDESVAKLYAMRYNNIDVSVPLSLQQDISWAVRKGAVDLKEFINNWLQDFIQSDHYAHLYAKYFTSDRSMLRLKSNFHSLGNGQISSYDDIIKREASPKGWDWRLISSIIYNESQFDTAASSWAGATGLMQLMPETAKAFGVEDLNDPEQNIRGGIKLLSWLDSQLKSEITDSEERIKFVLAAYNVGLGHVMDAQRLAKKYGKDPGRWENHVDYFLLNKSSARYYSDQVVRWGYARGNEPYDFVASVMTHYSHYKNTIPR
jgi:membrane-bound lytic murein transglycosylase F